MTSPKNKVFFSCSVRKGYKWQQITSERIPNIACMFSYALNDQNVSPPFDLSILNKYILTCVKLPSIDIPPYPQNSELSSNSGIKIESCQELHLSPLYCEPSSSLSSEIAETCDSKNNNPNVCAEPSNVVDQTVSFDAIRNSLDSKFEKHACCSVMCPLQGLGFLGA